MDGRTVTKLYLLLKWPSIGSQSISQYYSHLSSLRLIYHDNFLSVDERVPGFDRVHVRPVEADRLRRGRGVRVRERHHGSGDGHVRALSFTADDDGVSV